MLKVRRSGERGHADHGWLNTYHTFSFAGYHDPEQMGFRTLRVINEDRVRGGYGFPMHGHSDMEIISYVVEGGLAHKDSMGHEAVLRPGEVQLISAGTGIRHSEFNASPSEPVHFLQIWIRPAEKGLAPRYEQKAFPAEARAGRLLRVAGGRPQDGQLRIGQDADLYASVLAPDETVEHRLKDGRHGWIQVIRGRVGVNGTELAAGDGAGVSDEPLVSIRAREASELLLFDLG